MVKGSRRLTCKGLQALTYKKAKRGKAEEEYRTVPWFGKKKLYQDTFEVSAVC